ncbi:P-loop NTPase [Tersicoccus sp. MR15.9]|uniref:AAA family ATPase n=1 Tax=Tersicoccus mangrovi TaxID=3121635 RepID=UPI002FE59DA8
MSVPLAILGDTPADHVAGLERLRGPVTVVRRCAEAADLLAVCESGLAEVALIAERVDDLPGHLIERMTGSGIPVLALTGDREWATWLEGLGVRVLPPGISTADLAAAVLGAAADPGSWTARGATATDGPGEEKPRQEATDGGVTPFDGTEAERRSDAPARDDPSRGEPDARDHGVGGRGAGADDADDRGLDDRGSGEPDADAPKRGHGLGRWTDRTRAETTDIAKPRRRVGGGSGTGTGAASTDQPTGEPAVTPDEQPGVVIAVWGPTGAPGRSTVAVNLAAELAAELGTAYLVDVDTYGSSTAVMLGLLDETAPVAQACRLADQGLLDVAALHRVAADVVVGGGRLRALTGITRPDRWPEVRASALSAVIDLCRQTARATVIDCGFCLEADEELSFDTVAPRRNGATLRALERADVVIAVGSADAIGLPRLVKGIAELAEAVPTATPTVVVNRVRRESVGRGSRQQIRAAWERYGPDLPLAALLPDDPSADAALLGGTVLRESAPASALRAGIRTLAPDLLGRDAGDGSVRRGWFRRPSVTHAAPAAMSGRA